MSPSSSVPPSTAARATGAHQLAVALGLAGLAWLAMTVQEILLFARPTPYGGPYAERWSHYFPYSLAYNVLAVMLISALPMLGWLLWYRRQVGAEIARNVHGLQLALLMFAVSLDHADNEVMRFMGVHLSLGLLHAYHRVNAWGNDMLYIFLYDQGGPGLPFLIIVASPLVLWLLGRQLVRRASPAFPLFPRPMAFMAILFPLVVPVVAYQYFPGRLFIWQQTRPALLTLYAELKGSFYRGDRPEQFRSLAKEYQLRWYQNSGDTAWQFPDPQRPLMRVPQTAATQVRGKRWNVLYIQLETFRGWNTGFLRPDIADSPTPFLDRLARDSESAFWRRHLSMGPPTVSGMMAGLCSIKPHSSAIITTTFTYTALECLPTVLRRHGYVAEAFTVSDPDWDGEKNWLRKWYDQFHYYEDANNADRVVFRRAADRIRELGRGPRPFFASVTSISNHYPFRGGEPQFSRDPVHPQDRPISNTMRYTDDVVREFIESLKKEAWFEHTLVVVFGDHGYELGEHSRRGQHNGWRESVWVPLIIHGPHPRLPRGGQNEMATLLDLAPTIADLLGIREPTPWMGASLLPDRKRLRSFALVHWGAAWGEWDRFSMVVDPVTGKGLLYDAIKDPLQQFDISAQHPEIVAALRRQAQDEGKLVDYLLEGNWVWQSPAPAPNATQ